MYKKKLPRTNSRHKCRWFSNNKLTYTQLEYQISQYIL